MEEQEFRRLLDLFPIVRSRDYHAESEITRTTNSNSTKDEVQEWQDAWSDIDNKETETQGINSEDPFWDKLRMAAEKKVGPVEADKFCKDFQRVHRKLVYEELSSDAARRFLKSTTDLNGLD